MSNGHSCSAIIEATEAEFEALMARFANLKAARAAFLPDEAACLKVLADVRERLKELGWKEQVPFDHAGKIDVIEAGCSAVHQGRVAGRFDRAGVWVWDGGDSWPSEPFMWRPAVEQ